MANTNIVIDTRRPKNDNTYPIYLRLTHDRKSRNIATGTSVPEEHWNYKKNCVKSSYEFAARLINAPKKGLNLTKVFAFYKLDLFF